MSRNHCTLADNLTDHQVSRLLDLISAAKVAVRELALAVNADDRDADSADPVRLFHAIAELDAARQLATSLERHLP